MLGFLSSLPLIRYKALNFISNCPREYGIKYYLVLKSTRKVKEYWVSESLNSISILTWVTNQASYSSFFLQHTVSPFPFLNQICWGPSNMAAPHTSLQDITYSHHQGCFICDTKVNPNLTYPQSRLCLHLQVWSQAECLHDCYVPRWGTCPTFVDVRSLPWLELTFI